MTTNVQRYNRVAILLHWSTALLILYMLIWGEGLIKSEGGAAPSNPGLHASLGLAILMLTAVRLAWRFLNPPPPEVPMSALQSKLSHALHWGFYVLLVFVPVSGLAALGNFIAGKHPEYASFTFFNLFQMPYFSMPVLGETHEILTKLIWALLAVHVVAALKHQFIDKDNLMKRMSLR